MNSSDLDAYSPAQIAHRVESVGVSKASLPVVQTLTLALLAGVFISLGAMLYTLVMSDTGSLPMGLHRWIAGMAFSLGLILVVIAGAELFTGNNLIIMAWADRKISSPALLRNWSLVYLGNFIGALGAALLMIASGSLDPGVGSVRQTAITIAESKIALGTEQAFIKAILCNLLVCLAVWLATASHRVSGKILCILFPISAFVALGFEHSIANMYLIPVGMLAADGNIAWLDLFANLLPVTLGNIIGGGFVALIYWIIYLRGKGESF